MYIAPNSTIILISGVPLDPTYTDTIFFESEAQQRSAFMSYAKKRTFTQQSYQRVNKGTIRLQVPADSIYDYNYLMFQNTAYGNKWFYAFITSVEYVNDATSEIRYELDVMQTWMFDYTLEPSFVEREHSATDEIGDNIAPEPVDIGPVICDGIDTVGNNAFTNWCIIIACAENLPNN